MIDDGTIGSSDALAELALFGDRLKEALERVAGLDRNLQSLNELMLTGQPYAIADAATAVEQSLAEAGPLFTEITRMLHQRGDRRLDDTARDLRAADQEEGAVAAERLRTALNAIANRSAACHRRAQSLNRGLSASLRILHALGMNHSGRLIAEA